MSLTGALIVAGAGQVAGATPPASLSLRLKRMSTLLQGQTNAAYVIRVENAVSAGPTAGQVQVTVPAPAGLQITQLRGPGWSCDTSSCTRSDVLAPGQLYPAIMVLANVDASAPDPLLLQVSVAGGGDPNTVTAADTASVRSTATPVIFMASPGYYYVPMPPGLDDVVSVSLTGNRAAVRKNGTVAAWACQFDYECAVPAGLTNVIQVAAGYRYFVALKSDGTVMAWGPGDGGTGVPSGLSDVVQVAAGRYIAVALKADGTLVAWGNPSYVDAIKVGRASKIVDIAVGEIAYSLDSAGVPRVISGDSGILPSGITNAASIFTLDLTAGVLNADGTLTVWSRYSLPTNPVYATWSNLKSVAFGLACNLAWTNAGTFLMDGCDVGHQDVLPTDLQNVTAIFAGVSGIAALTSSPPTVPVHVNANGLPFVVDGTTYATAQDFNWTYDSGHELVALDTIGGRTGQRFRFEQWSNHRAQAQVYTADSTYRQVVSASYSPQYFLTTIATNGGTVSPASGWYDQGTIHMQATPFGMGTFTTYSGGLYSQNPSTQFYLTNATTIYAIFNNQPVPQNLLSVSPAAGTGSTASFTGAYHSAAGFNDLAWYEILVAADTNGGGQPYCFVHYDVPGNAFWLYGDGGFFEGPVTPGAASAALQNSLCALNTRTSSFSGSGADYQVTANLVFKGAATLNTYVRALTVSERDTYHLLKGTWNLTPAPLATMSQTLNASTGGQRAYTLTYPDPVGFEGAVRGWAQFLVAAGSDGGGQPFCFLHYDRGGNALWMYSSDVGFLLGPVAPGTASGALDSSACSVDTANSTAALAANALSLTVALTTKPSMSGPKNLYQRILDPLGRDSGWVQTGSATLP